MFFWLLFFCGGVGGGYVGGVCRLLLYINISFFIQFLLVIQK